MVGVFTIPIGQYMLDLKAERKRETAEIDNINKKLDEILQGELVPQEYGKIEPNVRQSINVSGND